jgi:hypothetical protein
MKPGLSKQGRLQKVVLKAFASYNAEGCIGGLRWAIVLPESTCTMSNAAVIPFKASLNISLCLVSQSHLKIAPVERNHLYNGWFLQVDFYLQLSCDI